MYSLGLEYGREGREKRCLTKGRKEGGGGGERARIHFLLAFVISDH